MAGSHSRNWYVVRRPTRFGISGSAASTNFMSFRGGLPRSWKNTRSYRRWGIGAWPRWTTRSTGISATSHAPNEGSADTMHATPAFASISWASSTAFVRSPTGNWSPTVFALRPRITSRSRSMSAIAGLDTRDGGKTCPRPRERLNTVVGNAVETFIIGEGDPGSDGSNHRRRPGGAHAPEPGPAEPPLRMGRRHRAPRGSAPHDRRHRDDPVGHVLVHHRHDRRRAQRQLLDHRVLQLLLRRDDPVRRRRDPRRGRRLARPSLVDLPPRRRGERLGGEHRSGP